MQSDFPPFNTETKALFWTLITKYENLYPDFADSLNQCILQEITLDNLAIIRNYQFGNLLEEIDTTQLQRAMNYIEHIALLELELE